MGAFQILDLIIGMAFVYFLLSLICVALQEIKARKYNERSENLKKWIYDTFRKDGDGSELGELLWNNIIIDGLTQDNRAASYVPKEVFVSALLDEIHYKSDDKQEKVFYQQNKIDSLAAKALHDPYDFQTIRESIENSTLLSLRIKRVLRQIHTESHGNLDTFRDRLERWFENAMDRNGGTFKKKAQTQVLYFAIAVTIALNVDSIRLINHFYNNPVEAARVADAAEKRINETRAIERDTSQTTKQLLAEVKSGIRELNELKLPIGWRKQDLQARFCKPDGFTKFGNVVMILLGWFITAIAVSLGAPFWYDMLNKLVDLRSAGKKPAPAPPAAGDSGKNSSDNPLG